LDRPLTVVTPTVDADVLAILAGAETSFTGRQVQQVSGRHSEKGVRNTLHRLCSQGIVLRERVGSADLYTLNRAHLAAVHIHALAGLRAELLQRISALLNTWEVPPAFAAMFGSAARGGMRPDSDIDLLVVRSDEVDTEGEDWRDQLAHLSERVTAWTGNDTRVLELSAAEVGAGLADDEQVLTDIRAEGIVLYGSTNYLRPPPRRRGQARRG
jgi:predicted nucleotidyltransferase